MSLHGTWRPDALSRLLLLIAAALLAACSSLPQARFDASRVTPLQYGDVLLTGDEVRKVPEVDLLATTEEMRHFVRERTAGLNHPRMRLFALHDAIRSDNGLDVHYDPFADGSAQDVFRSGAANCLSYANLFVALAREAGLNASYQWMDIRPEWQRLGDRVAVRLHVNVQVKTRGSEEFMIDIDPLSRHRIAGAKLISDAHAAALYHGNEAMVALSDGRVEEAWRRALRALELAPDLSHLWVNLGAIYRGAGQNEAAEEAYFKALSLDATDRSAMNNLVVLYEVTGRSEEEAYWLDRMHRYRMRNPYYHANLGDLAGAEGDWDAAFEHYEEAVRLHPQDSELIYGLGLIEYQRGNYDVATRLVEQAIEEANFEVDQHNYRAQLKAMQAKLASPL